ncbi:hypothetical protein SAMN02910298_00667 [Pseudobutyrivibrio sp. YE44]|uniref:hypothetical protein n=1 Tax=Pseudobutyrivibrio sp. YE44 TaxID=1520802 RepID=UPI00088D6943|nr:hypothetical protein [Pseudobutyrivibrio sp. YE44]SDB12878.1 hypothetical protein SAMN02910298_00667 [Pseudobutyrivibrio sp. YE44]
MNSFKLVLLLILIPVCGLFSWIAGKYNQGHYDERQEMLRGKANKYSLNAMAIFLGVYFCYDVILGDYLYRLSASVLALITICLGTIVFTVYSIWKEAYSYFNVNQKATTSFILFAFIALLNLGIFAFGFGDMKAKEIFVNGVIQYSSPFTQLFVGIIFGTMSITYFARLFVNRAQED